MEIQRHIPHTVPRKQIYVRLCYVQKWMRNKADIYINQHLESTTQMAPSLEAPVVTFWKSLPHAVSITLFLSV